MSQTDDRVAAGSGPTTGDSQFARFRAGLTARDRRSLAGMAGVVVLLHLIGFGVLFAFVVPAHYKLGGDHPVFTAGVGLLAYTFGLRHAFDADHIAAVDNTTRKLMADNAEQQADGVPADQVRKPLSVGFWFSLGHSTIVFALSLGLAFGIRALVKPVTHQNSGLHDVTGIIGASVSGGFLWILGIVNFVTLIGILKVFRELRHGRYDEAELEEHLNKRGFMNRILGGLTRSVRKAWHIYPVGVLFGLGFDTATEVGLLVLAAGAAAIALPWYAIVVLPVLFASGMCMMDSVDGVFMNAAYGWAFAKPVRKVFYNLTITTISILVALVIGTIELVSVLADQTHTTHGVIGWIGGIDLDYAGYAIVGLFVLSWLVALAVWKFGRIEERWSPDPLGPSA